MYTIYTDQNYSYAKIISNMGLHNSWKTDSELQLKVDVDFYSYLNLKANSVTGQVCKAK